MKAKDIMQTSVITVGPDTMIQDIAKILSENNISGVPVVDDDKIVGIVSEGDLLHKEANPRIPTIYPISAFGSFTYLGDYKKYEEDIKKLSAMKASEIMTTEVISESEDTDINKIASIMIDKKINRIPITRDGKLVGIVSRADLIKILGQ